MLAEETRTPIKVKKIGHVVYEVSDVERSTHFWTEIMGFTVSDRNENGMVFLHSAGDHHSIALVPSPGKGRPGKGSDVLQIHHWAMEVDSVETLFKAREFLQARGIPITFEGRRGAGCNIGVEFKDPDGYTVEIYYGMDQLKEPGKARPSEEWKRAKSLESAVENPVVSH
jgi:catechol 2,3-dioxygenase-like lactoylglutathione lyase family enzyme